MRSSLTAVALSLLVFTVSCSSTGGAKGQLKVRTDPKAPMKVGVMVVPRGHKYFTLNTLIAQGPGTGYAWYRDKGRIDLGEFKMGELGSDITDTAGDGARRAGIAEDEVDGYLKELKALGFKGTFVSTLGFHPIDADALVTWSKLDVDKYTPVQLQLVGKTKDRMIAVYKIERDLTR